MPKKHEFPQWYRLLLLLRGNLSASSITHDLCRKLQCSSSSLHRAIWQLENCHGYKYDDGESMIGRLWDKDSGEMRYYLKDEPFGGPTNTNIHDVLHRQTAEMVGNL